MAGLGGSLALARRFSASRYWSDIRTSGATITTMMGSIPQILWSQPPSPQDREHKLRVVNLSPFPKFVIEFQERFNIPHVAGGYGLTDYGAVTMLTEKDLPAKLGACGPTHFDWQLRILDEEDFPLGPHQVGEIALWNPTPWHTSFGYYNMPEATVATRRNGWFHTGDRGYLDEDGFLWFVDRKKDSIRRRGENISAYEVEQVIMSHPAVADVAVYPLASEMGEDEVATSIVLRAGATLTEASLIEFCRNNMAYFMVPRFVQFLSDLPRNFSQKIEKYKLKAAAEADRTALWDREKAGIKITR